MTVVWEFLKIKVFLEKLSLFTSLVRCVLFGPNSEQILFAVRTFFIVSVCTKHHHHHHHQFLLSLRVHRASMYNTYEPCMCSYNSVRRGSALASCILCVLMNALLLLGFLQKYSSQMESLCDNERGFSLLFSDLPPMPS